MLKISIILVFSFMSLCVFGCCRISADTNEVLFYKILDSALVARQGVDAHTIDKVFDLKKNSNNANKYFVQLLDYYIGSASGEVLDEFISSGGDSFLPLLTSKKNDKIQCEEKYSSICIKSKEHRNKRIEKLIMAIESGVALKAAE